MAKLWWHRAKPDPINQRCTHCNRGKNYPTAWCDWCNYTGIAPEYQCRYCRGRGAMAMPPNPFPQHCPACKGSRVEEMTR